MSNKILRLSPIKSEASPTNTLPHSSTRVLNLEKLEIYQYEEEYFINSPIGELELKSGDELLIGETLWRVSFFEQNHTDNSLFKQENQDFSFEDEDELRPLSRLQKRDHPLAFLFHNGRTDD